MPSPVPSLVDAPAGYVSVHAVAFGATGATATPVDATHPLPTARTVLAATSTPLAGSASASGSIGPFTPQLARAIWLTLSGTWAGTVTVQRSIDGGTTKLPLTVGGLSWASFTANANEPIGEESVASATYWLAVTLTSGTLAYRVQQ